MTKTYLVTYRNEVREETEHIYAYCDYDAVNEAISNAEERKQELVSVTRESGLKLF